MKYGSLFVSLAILAAFAGCADSTANRPGHTTLPLSPPTILSAEVGELDIEPGEFPSQEIQLTPENTTIAFVGKHVGDEPKPRHGQFQRFNGVAVVGKNLESVTVEIDTSSLSTEIEKLTNHLKQADFFDVVEFPKATFTSTQISEEDEGAVTITGELTMLGKTESVSFPASVNTEAGLQLKAEFAMDRTRWGMDYGLDQIEKQVEMTITIDH